MSLTNRLTQSQLFQNRNLLWGVVVAVIMQAGLWLYVSTAARPAENVVPLHYNIYFGIDLFAEWYKIFWIPLSGTIILIINALALLTVLRNEKILSAAAVTITLLIQVALFASVYLVFSQIFYS